MAETGMLVINWLVTRLIAAVAYVAAATGSVPEPSVSPTFAPGGIAIRGYDTVAYFTDGAPRPGDPDIAFVWNGVAWHFASTAHRDLFVAAPERYAPQYGGYCAWGVNFGYTASTDPGSWDIVDGKLYLNNAPWVHTIWGMTKAANIAWADLRWPRLMPTGHPTG